VAAAADGKREMRPRRISFLLSLALAAAAAVGPPVAAASGEGGGAVAGPGASSGSGGGAAYGVAVPAPKRHKHHARRASDSGSGSGHRFPIAGSFAWGGRDARFGARRKGHRHQGQDLPAALGTRIVSPHAGVVEAVDYQAGAAGNYVVIDSDGEDYDFAFMHLRTGSVRVVVGQHVRAGERIGDVGSTGESSGPHLHFEVWVGGWYVGGHPIDPLRLLRSWA
jgi:murein DD-endopeptidase MepM/ murein hydrolase activator NlpD